MSKLTKLRTHIDKQRGMIRHVGKKKDEKLEKKFEKLDKKEEEYPGYCQKKGPLGMECTLKANHPGKCDYL